MSGINTKMIHGYKVIDEYTGSASVPKYQTSTFDQRERYIDQKFTYSRFGNPTIAALEDAICKIEDAKFGFAFSSGMSAISAVLMLLKTGDHIILPCEVYGGTCQFAKEILPEYGIDATFVDFSNIENVTKAIRENTRMVYLETPSNPLLKVTDIRRIVDLLKGLNILTVSDNTFMTSLYQNCLHLGCDIVVESMTKFINGHSDVVAGLAVTNSEVIAKRLCLYQKNFGAVLGVEDAWLVLRGLKTLGLRIEKSVSNAQAVAEYLQSHPRVKTVFYPGLKSHPNHDIQIKQGSNGGSILSFELEKSIDIKLFANALNLPIYAVSLGGVETILSHPASMSHACLCKKERAEQGVTDRLLRYSCGIEDVEDLIEDLRVTLENI